MVNCFKGEVLIIVDGKEYIFCCDFNVLCYFEEVIGKDVMEIFEEFERNKVLILVMCYMMYVFF